MRFTTATTLLIFSAFENFSVSAFVSRTNKGQPWPSLSRRTTTVTTFTTVGATTSKDDSNSDKGTVTIDTWDTASATNILAQWDALYNPETVASSNNRNDTETATQEQLRPKLVSAVQCLNQVATNERNADSTKGRVMLGICAASAQQGVATLKSWVTALQLPRGLLHGMDRDGVPLELDDTGVYIKYNSGGVYTFADIRKSGLGFDALWKPGDALLEPYDGTYRGVYFQVELADQVFRQFLVPLDLFDPID